MPHPNSVDPSIDSFDDAEVLSMSDGDMSGPSDGNSENSFAYGPGNISINLGTASGSTTTMFSPLLDSNFRNATSLHDSASANALPRLPHGAVKAFTYPSGSKTAAAGLTFYLLGCDREATAQKILLPIAGMFPPELEYTLAWVPPKSDTDGPTPSSSFFVPATPPGRSTDEGDADKADVKADAKADVKADAAQTADESHDSTADGDDTKTDADFEAGDNEASHWAAVGSPSVAAALSSQSESEPAIYKFHREDRSFSLQTSEPSPARRAVVLLYYGDGTLDMDAELRQLEQPVLRKSARTGVLRAVSRLHNPLVVPIAPHILDPKAYLCESIITSSNAPLLEVQVDSNSSQYRAKVPLTTALLHRVKLEEFSVPRGKEVTLRQLNDPKTIPWTRWICLLLALLTLAQTAQFSYATQNSPGLAVQQPTAAPVHTPAPSRATPAQWTLVEKPAETDIIGDACRLAHAVYKRGDETVREAAVAVEPYARHAADVVAAGLNELWTLLVKMANLAQQDFDTLVRFSQKSFQRASKASKGPWEAGKAKLHAARYDWARKTACRRK